jgi:hypothetical protein
VVVVVRTFAASSGALYSLVLEYRHVGGRAGVRLEYTEGNTPRQVHLTPGSVVFTACWRGM